MPPEWEKTKFIEYRSHLVVKQEHRALPNVTFHLPATILGKKNKVWERRLMKDFKVGPVATEDDEELLYAPPPADETATARFRRIAKLAILNSGMNKWRQIVKGACIASQIGHCHNRDSFKKQQNLQKAILAAQHLSSRSPDISRSVTPINLPDITGSSMINIVKDFDGYKLNPSSGSVKRETELPLPLPPKKQCDLINFDSKEMSPSLQGSPRPSSFKHILGSEFSPEMIMEIQTKRAPSNIDRSKPREIGNVVREDRRFEIQDVLDTSTLTCSTGEVQLGSVLETHIKKSPSSPISSEETEYLTQENISFHLNTPTQDSFDSKVDEELSNLQTDKLTVFLQETPSIPQTLTPIIKRNSCAEKKSKPALLRTNVDQTQTKTDKTDTRSPIPISEILINDSSVLTDLSSSIMQTEELPPKNSYGSGGSENVSTDVQLQNSAPDNVVPSDNSEKQSEETVTDAMKMGGPSVTFSSLFDDELAESIKQVEPLFPGKIEVPTKFTISSSLITDDQKPSTSSVLTSSSTIQSPSASEQEDSPTDSGNIRRVQKKYQPKHGWL